MRDYIVGAVGGEKFEEGGSGEEVDDLDERDEIAARALGSAQDLTADGLFE